MADDDQAKEPSARIRGSDAQDNEFRFYSKLLPNLILTLWKDVDIKLVLPWIHKLSSPGYNVSQLRDKRNRYMLMLCLCLVANSLEGPFCSHPPKGVLLDITRIPRPCIGLFDWEKDDMWEYQLSKLNKTNCPSKILKRRCVFHRKKCPPVSCPEEPISQLLDRQFKFFLYIAKPYAAMLIRSSDRIRASRWMQILCSIDDSYCILSKAIRNDYMTVLAGYLTSQTIIGPFEDYPVDRLFPLAELTVKKEPMCIIDPTHPRTLEFFKNISQPEEGAFAYIAITGDLCNT